MYLKVWGISIIKKDKRKRCFGLLCFVDCLLILLVACKKTPEYSIVLSAILHQSFTKVVKLPIIKKAMFHNRVPHMV
jgi:hypothetical protein